MAKTLFGIKWEWLLIGGLFFMLYRRGPDSDSYNEQVSDYKVDKSKLSVPDYQLKAEAEVIFQTLYGVLFTASNEVKGMKIIGIFTNKNTYDLNAINHYFGVRKDDHSIWGSKDKNLSQYLHDKFYDLPEIYSQLKRLCDGTMIYLQ